MSILTWIEDKKRLKVLNAPKYVNSSSDSSKGLWTRCDKCGVILYIKHLKENQRVCFGCSYHLQMMSQERIENLLDKVPVISSSFLTEQTKNSKKAKLGLNESLRAHGTRLSSRENMISTWRPLDETVSPCDPLKFIDQKNYTDRLQDAQDRTGLQDAIQTGTGMIDGIPVALAVMDFSFMGGSMGSVVGEKITRLIEYATQEGLTLIIVSASGGARMQEGVFSLMQMAKISSALHVYQSCAKLLYISILTSPTTGGVTASFAMLGDIIFAEPKALIAFAGRRVIEQTLCEDLPDDFQTSEYMLHHGLIDLIVPRRFLRQALSESIKLYQNAPFKKLGRIPFGVQNPITFLTEEKIRRQWGPLTKKGTKIIDKEQYQSKKLHLFASGESSTSFVKIKDQFHLHEQIEGKLAIHRRDKTDVLRNRGTIQYREILTSFQTMLNLFSSLNTRNCTYAQTNLSDLFVQNDTRPNRKTKSTLSPRSIQKRACFTDKSSTNKNRIIKPKDLHFARTCNSAKRPCNVTKHKYSIFEKNTPSISNNNLRYTLHCCTLHVRATVQSVTRQKEFNGANKINDLHVQRNATRQANNEVFQYLSSHFYDTDQTPKTKRQNIIRYLFTFQPKKSLIALPILKTFSCTNKSERFVRALGQHKKEFTINRSSIGVQITNYKAVPQAQKVKCAPLGMYRRYKTNVLHPWDTLSTSVLHLRSILSTYVPTFPSFQNRRCTYLQNTNGKFVEQTNNVLLKQNFVLLKQNLARTCLEYTEGVKHTCLENGKNGKKLRCTYVQNLFKKLNNNRVSLLHSGQEQIEDQFAPMKKQSKTDFSGQKNDINFLNQALELAATESVQWRAFYIDQQLSENIDFLDDYLRDHKNDSIKNANILFYNAICRNAPKVQKK